MNLHRSENISDWHDTPIKDRNLFQLIGSATGGIVTPGNIVSSCGLILNIEGSKDIRKGRTWLGIGKSTLSFIADKVDGAVAEKTKTKSQLGAKLDVGADIYKHFNSVKTYYEYGLISDATTVSFSVSKIANMIFTAVAMKRGIQADVGYLGKITTAAQAVTFIAEPISNQLRNECYWGPAELMDRVSDMSRFTANTFSILTAFSYGARMLKSPDS